jgi:NAD(P)-dependent dehydrogenase (short-subunit alcohol dehydrogenase family)
MGQKTVVITGGNRGIGLSITESFLAAGYSVVVGARDQSSLPVRVIDKITFVPVDVSKEDDHIKLVDTALKITGNLDCFINNAGFSEWRPIEKIDEPFFDTLINTNLKGAFWGCKAAAAVMEAGGNIINISSIAGKRGSANNSMYSASKFGMNGLTQSLSKELGPRSIRVNALCPVLIPTEGLIDALTTEFAPANGSDALEFIKKFGNDNAALKRLPTGPEVGSMCVFLASTEASAITGQCINVDCGVLPQ